MITGDGAAGGGAATGDEGLADQRARTALAWTRTLLGCTAVGLLTARAAWTAGATSPALLSVPLLIAALGVLVALRRSRRLRLVGSAAPDRAVLSLTGVVVGLALLSTAALLVTWGSP